MPRRDCEFTKSCGCPAIAEFYHAAGLTSWYCQRHYDMMMDGCVSMGLQEGRADWFQMWKLNGSQR